MASDDPDDQVRTTSYGVLKGSLTQMTATTLKATLPAGSVYTFTKPYTCHYGHGVVQFHRGQSYHLDPTLKATLLAAGAPMVPA